MEECAADQDCAVGSRCHAVFDTCSPDGQGSACRAPCTGNECGAGFRCTAGACEAIPCSELDACSAFEQCDDTFQSGTPVHARTDGCASVACTGDGDCPAQTVCTNGRCQSGAGSCGEVIAVP